MKDSYYLKDLSYELSDLSKFEELTKMRNVFTYFPSNCLDSIIFSIINSFTQQDYSDNFNHEFYIEWLFQVISVSLSFKNNSFNTIYNSLSILRIWMNNIDLYRATYPNTDKSKEKLNSFLKRCFISLSQVFESFNDDNNFELRLKLIHTVIIDIENCCKNMGDAFDEETWDLLIEVLICCAKYIFINYRETNNKQVLEDSVYVDLLKLIIGTIICSRTSKPKHWNKLLEMTKHVKEVRIIVFAWRSFAPKLFFDLVKSVISGDTNASLIGSQISGLNMSFSHILSKLSDKVLSSVYLTLIYIIKVVPDIMQDTFKGSNLYPKLPVSIFYHIFKDIIERRPNSDFKGRYVKLHFLASSLLLIDNNIFYSKCLELIQSENIFLLKYGHFFIKNYPSREFAELLLKKIDVDYIKQTSDLGFQLLFSSLLLDISELIDIDLDVLEKLMKVCKPSRLFLSTSYILLKTDIDSYIRNIKFDAEDHEEYMYSCMNVIANLPYIKLNSENIKELISQYLRYFSQKSKQESRRITQFLIQALNKWCNISQYVNLKESKENIRCQSFNRTLINTSDTSITCMHNFDVSGEYHFGEVEEYYAYGKTLFTVLKSTAPNVFYLHCRNRYGFTSWEIKDSVDLYNFSHDEKSETEYSFIKLLTEDIPNLVNRSQQFNFFYDLRLHDNIRVLDKDHAENLIKELDSIPESPVVYAQIVHIKDDQSELESLFETFYESLGFDYKIYDQNIKAIQHSLCTIGFPVDDSQVKNTNNIYACIYFVESHLDYHKYKDNTYPINIYIQPIYSLYYKVSVKYEKDNLWCLSSTYEKDKYCERVVKLSNIGQVISESIIFYLIKFKHRIFNDIYSERDAILEKIESIEHKKLDLILEMKKIANNQTYTD